MYNYNSQTSITLKIYVSAIICSQKNVYHRIMAIGNKKRRSIKASLNRISSVGMTHLQTKNSKWQIHPLKVSSTADETWHKYQ